MGRKQAGSDCQSPRWDRGQGRAEGQRWSRDPGEGAGTGSCAPGLKPRRAGSRTPQICARIWTSSPIRARWGRMQPRAGGFEPTVIGRIVSGATTAQDTREAAREMLRAGIDLLLFAGGDGTARDIYRAIGEDLPALGIPAGVKIHSAVYATNPASAGSLAALYLQGRVTSLRGGRGHGHRRGGLPPAGTVSAKLYGYLKIPFRTSLVQNQKTASIGGSSSLTAIAEDVVERMEDDCAVHCRSRDHDPGHRRRIGPGEDAVGRGRLPDADSDERRD